ncbi:MAG: histidine phosphatase family protein [Cyclobacteriaceae bacterium]
MNTKKIYVVRHGQTDLNLKGIVQGSGVNSSLNETGKAQAFAFFEAYRHIPFNKIYTSALRRTQETVEPFNVLNIPTEALPGLNEISWGKKEGQPITPEEDAYYHHMLREWQNGNTSLRIEGGESPDEVVARMKPAVDHVMSQGDEKTILICMHGRAIRILLCYLLHYPLRSMDMFEHENACLYILNYTGSMFSVELYNNVDHLQSLKAACKV